MTDFPDINMTDEYETQDGQPVQVLTVNRTHTFYPVIVLLESGSVYFLRSDGKLESGSIDPFIRPKKKSRTVDVWVNVYPDGHYVFDDKEDAMQLRNEGCLATIKKTITVEW